MTICISLDHRHYSRVRRLAADYGQIMFERREVNPRVDGAWHQ